MIQVVLDSADKYPKLCWWAGDLLFWDAAVEKENYQKWLGQLTQLRGKEVNE